MYTYTDTHNIEGMQISVILVHEKPRHTHAHTHTHTQPRFHQHAKVAHIALRAPVRIYIMHTHAQVFSPTPKGSEAGKWNGMDDAEMTKVMHRKRNTTQK